MAKDPRDEDDELDEGPDESDLDDEKETPVDRCPKCGHYLTMALPKGSRVGAWIVLGFLLALAAVALYALLR